MICKNCSGPQSGDIVTDESHRGDTDTKSSSEAKKTSTESSFVTDGRVGTTRKNEVSIDQSEASIFTIDQSQGE